MTEADDRISRRLAPLVQEGVIGGHTVREVSAGMSAVTVSPRPKSRFSMAQVREQVERALADLQGIVVEIIP